MAVPTLLRASKLVLPKYALHLIEYDDNMREYRRPITSLRVTTFGDHDLSSHLWYPYKGTSFSAFLGASDSCPLQDPVYQDEAEVTWRHQRLLRLSNSRVFSSRSEELSGSCRHNP